jgi:uncharacterized protein (TIGR02679 family)
MTADVPVTRTSPAPAPGVRLPETTRAYLADPALAPVWEAVAARLERNGLRATGTVQVPVAADTVEPLAGLLRASGKPVKVQAGSMRLRLADLDVALRRSAAAAGVVAVLGTLRGAPLVDRAAARERERAERGDVAAALDAALVRAGLADASWAGSFVDGVRRSGLLTRAGNAAPVAVAEAGAVLAALADAGTLQPRAGAGEAGWELAALATRCTGSAHGLDEGRVTALLVLRAAAAALGVPLPETPAGRRELWARLGVAPDLVSGTVLAWGLRPAGDDGWSVMMRQRADLSVMTHLTVHELRGPAADVDVAEPGTVVSVCENPQVLQAAVRAGAAGPLLCISGNPASAGWLLLRRLVAAGVAVRYHGDFDWPGVAIAGRLYAAGVQPWRMGAADYRAAVTQLPEGSRLPLAGSPAATGWDPALAEAMRRAQVAVHEESLLDVLLADL